MEVFVEAAKSVQTENSNPAKPKRIVCFVAFCLFLFFLVMITRDVSAFFVKIVQDKESLRNIVRAIQNVRCSRSGFETSFSNKTV